LLTTGLDDDPADEATAGPSWCDLRQHPKDADGYIRLNGLRLRTGAKRDAR
jgi:hypothetical protein